MKIFLVLLPIAVMVQACVAAPSGRAKGTAAFEDALENYMQSAGELIDESMKVADNWYAYTRGRSEYNEFWDDLEDYMEYVHFVRNHYSTDDDSYSKIIITFLDLINKYETEISTIAIAESSTSNDYYYGTTEEATTPYDY